MKIEPFKCENALDSPSTLLKYKKSSLIRRSRGKGPKTPHHSTDFKLHIQAPHDA